MKRNPIVFIFFLVLFFLAAGYLSSSFLLPRYIEKRILPSLGDKLSTSLTGQVFSIGLHEASLGDLIIGDTNNIAVSVGSIQTKYSVFSILDKKIEEVRINGLTLNLEISEGKIIIPGLDLGKIAGTKTKNKISQPSSAISLPLLLDTFQVSNGFFNVSYKNQRILIPFNLQITRKERADITALPAYQLNLQISPQGEQIVISGTIDFAKNKGIFTLSADSLDMEPFAFLLGELQEILSFGEASIIGNVETTLMPFQLVATEIDCEFESVNFKNVPVSFAPPAGIIDAKKPLRLKIMGKEQQWDIAAHGSIAEPLSASISIDGTFVQGDDKGSKGLGSILIKIAERASTLGPGNIPVIIKGHPELHGNFSVDITPTGAWLGKIESSARKEILKISYDQYSLESKVPSFNIRGNGYADAAQIQISLAIADVHATGIDASEIILPMAELQASFTQKKISGQEILSSGEFALSIPGVKITRDAFAGRGDIKLAGKIKPQQLQDLRSLQVAGELIINKAKAEELKSSIKINSIEGRIPWHWSLPNRETTGRLKISGIQWKNNDLGSFAAETRVKNSAYWLDGKFSHSLPGGLETNIKGQAGKAESGYHASLLIQMDATPFTSLHLGKFDQSLKNTYLSGELGLHSKFSLDTNAFKGNMDIRLQNGRFEYPEKKYTLENINFTLLMPSLPDLRSAPAQKLLFEKASVGDLTIEQGKIIWQLEAPDSIFIEEAVVRWAGGRVFTNAVRISPNRKEFVIPIFCDRLILADILGQFGITNAGGEGTVSGRIPLLAGKGTVRFEDGFLYSSPGQGGSIKVAAFDLLSAGIPKNNPQFTQVDFAAEALKNFKYNWVKLLFNSEGEDLIMQMQMDGKPLQSLPFKYDTQTGLMQRVDDSSIGIDQPIRLDVNFRLPLNRFLGYSGKIQDIMKKMQ